MFLFCTDTNGAVDLERVTFAEMNKKESDVEELLRNNINLLSEDEESLLLVGEQVRNEAGGRCDLVALDGDGNLVLIEIKRDKQDILGKKEAFEAQAIRYASNCATIRTKEELLEQMYIPYVSKREAQNGSADGNAARETAKKELSEFIDGNNISRFNEHQRIILTASGFDDQTLSAAAWLNRNGVDISCYEMAPYQMPDGQIVIDVKKILPVPALEDFFVSFSGNQMTQDRKNHGHKRSLPKIDALIENEILQPGAILRAKGHSDEAVLQKDGTVEVQNTGATSSLQQWLRQVFGWSAVDTYNCVIDASSGKTLYELREEMMAKSREKAEG